MKHIAMTAALVVALLSTSVVASAQDVKKTPLKKATCCMKADSAKAVVKACCKAKETQAKACCQTKEAKAAKKVKKAAKKAERKTVDAATAASAKN